MRKCLMHCAQILSVTSTSNSKTSKWTADSDTAGMPSCKSQMISLCPNCGFLLIGNSHAHICGFCKADIRLSFANSQSGTRTAGDCILVPTDFVDGGSHRLVRDRLPKK